MLGFQRVHACSRRAPAKRDAGITPRFNLPSKEQ